MKIGEKIKELRTKNNMSREQLAIKLKILETKIEKIEEENIVPHEETLRKISNIFNVTISSLIDDTKEIETKELPSLLSFKQSSNGYFWFGFFFCCISILLSAIVGAFINKNSEENKNAYYSGVVKGIIVYMILRALMGMYL